MTRTRKLILQLKWWAVGWMLFVYAWWEHFVVGREEDLDHD